MRWIVQFPTALVVGALVGLVLPNVFLERDPRVKRRKIVVYGVVCFAVGATINIIFEYCWRPSW